MQSIVHSPVGLLHLAASCAALILGLAILCLQKGTARHKRMGYAYVVSMLTVNGTAFLIYQLWGRFGVFHWFAVLSLLTLLAGILPLFLVRERPRARSLHLSFMYWSVIGLYSALVAEIMVRIPHALFRGNFGLAINVSIFSLMGLGGVLFGYLRQKWHRDFGID